MEIHFSPSRANLAGQNSLGCFQAASQGVTGYNTQRKDTFQAKFGATNPARNEPLPPVTHAEIVTCLKDLDASTDTALKALDKAKTLDAACTAANNFLQDYWRITEALWGLKSMKRDYPTALSHFMCEVSHQLNPDAGDICAKLEQRKMHRPDDPILCFFPEGCDLAIYLPAYFKGRLESLRNSLYFYNTVLENGLESSRLTPTTLLQMALTPQQARLSEKNLQLTTHGLDNPLFNGQQAIIPNVRLYSIFHNLLQNAVKYTPAGSVDIRLEPVNAHISGTGVTEGPEGRPMLKYTVTDTGIGIPEAEQETVTQGQRAGNAKASGIEGTGYGLKRVRSLVEKHQGRMIMTSPLHQQPTPHGTAITCYLPLMATPGETQS